MASSSTTETSLEQASIQVNAVITDKESALFAFFRDAMEHMEKRSTMGVVTRVAGGWCRDKILGRPNDDVDLAVNVLTGVEFAAKVQEYVESAEVQLAEKFKVNVVRSNPEKSKHLETAIVDIHGFKVDIVNLRGEVYDEDSRVPTMAFGTAADDAFRRDLTINSLFYNLNEQRIEDFTGAGLRDLAAGLVRTPCAPQRTFLDDPLRVLRALRFASRFGFDLDESLAAAVLGRDAGGDGDGDGDGGGGGGGARVAENDKATRVLRSLTNEDKISRERVGEEVRGMLCPKHAALRRAGESQRLRAITMLLELGALGAVLYVPRSFEGGKKKRKRDGSGDGSSGGGGGGGGCGDSSGDSVGGDGGGGMKAEAENSSGIASAAATVATSASALSSAPLSTGSPCSAPTRTSLKRGARLCSVVSSTGATPLRGVGSSSGGAGGGGGGGEGHEEREVAKEGTQSDDSSLWWIQAVRCAAVFDALVSLLGCSNGDAQAAGCAALGLVPSPSLGAVLGSAKDGVLVAYLCALLLPSAHVTLRDRKGRSASFAATVARHGLKLSNAVANAVDTTLAAVTEMRVLLADLGAARGSGEEEREGEGEGEGGGGGGKKGEGEQPGTSLRLRLGLLLRRTKGLWRLAAALALVADAAMLPTSLVGAVAASEVKNDKDKKEGSATGDSSSSSSSSSSSCIPIAIGDVTQTVVERAAATLAHLESRLKSLKLLADPEVKAAAVATAAAAAAAAAAGNEQGRGGEDEKEEEKKKRKKKKKKKGGCDLPPLALPVWERRPLLNGTALMQRLGVSQVYLKRREAKLGF